MGASSTASTPADTGGDASQSYDGGPVTVRYWAAARAAAGRPEDRVSAATVADALAAIRRLHPDARFGQVLGVSSLLIGDRPVGAADPASIELSPGDIVEVLPPFAGG